MSWIFEFIGNHDISPDSNTKFCALHPPPLHTIEQDTFYLAVGGLAQTCHHGVFDAGGESDFRGWAVVGLGIDTNSANHQFVSSEKWQKFFAPSHPGLTALDGHFVAIRWKPGLVQCYTDRLGLRTLFLLEMDNGCAFSTRLDWLAQFKRDCKIDFRAFGAHWLTFNQLSYECCVHGIGRLGPAGVAVCTPASIRTTHQPYLPDFSKTTHHSLEAILHPFLHFQNSGGEVSLGLSGGLDSRTLLALLAADRHRVFALHVFGHAGHPDVRIARQIATREGFSLRHFDEPLPDAETCWRWLQDYAAQACVVEPASALLHTRYYPQLFAKNKIVIDGGFGEIARRQFFNRILRRGRRALESGAPAAIYPFLRVFRAAVFRHDVLQIMQAGTEQQIASRWQAMPAIDEIGRENFLDLLAIRTRLPNYYGFEQSRLDGEGATFMPFAQPSFLQFVFDTPVHARRNGRLFRRTIRQHCPSLAAYPLVKGATSYPFFLGTVPAWLWTQCKARLGRSFADPVRAAFLGSLSELLADLVRSAEVRTYPAYNHRALAEMVDGFLVGKTEYGQQVDWWLSFEAWRRSVQAQTM